MAAQYLANVRGMNSEKRTEQIGGIQKMFSKSKEFGDDKVQLAMQTYEMVNWENIGEELCSGSQNSVELLVPSQNATTFTVVQLNSTKPKQNL